MSSQDPITNSIQGVSVESGRAMGSAGKGAGSSDDGGATELFKVNQIWYKLPPTLSLVAKRTLLINMAQRPTYINPYNDVITFIMNTGEFYTSMSSSYLYFEIGFNSPVMTDLYPTVANENVAPSPTGSYQWAKALISQGNAMSLFEEVVFLSASGTEVCREQNKGLESAIKFRYDNDQRYINTIGQVQGAAYGNYSANYDGVGPIPDASFAGQVFTGAQVAANTIPSMTAAALNPIGGFETLILPRSGEGAKVNLGIGVQNLNNTKPGTVRYVSVCIPMDQVLGGFKTYMSTLYPAGALAGGRLELRLKNPVESIQFTAGMVESAIGITPNTYLTNLVNAAQTGFVINRSYIVYDAFQLQDNVLKRLNAVSAGQDGLSVLFDTYDHTSQLSNGIGTVEAQVQQARSRIVRSFCVVRDTANINNPYINSLASEAIVTRVSAVDTPGYYNLAGMEPLTYISAGPTTNVTNSRGINGGMTFLTYPDSTGNTQSPLATDGKNHWSPFVTTVVDPGQTGYLQIYPTPYPWIFKPRLPADYYGQAAAGGPKALPFSTNNLIVTSYQAQLGSLFFPQQPLTTASEYYQNAQYLWCKGVPDKCDVNSVSLNDFIGGLGWGLYDPTIVANVSSPTNQVNLTFPPTPQSGGSSNDPTLNDMWGYWIAPYGCAIFGMLAEKSQALQLSGLPISNARLMRHKFTFAYNPLSGTSRTISVFTQYTRVMKVFLGGRIVVRE
jgi:hypothetical protein